METTLATLAPQGILPRPLDLRLAPERISTVLEFLLGVLVPAGVGWWLGREVGLPRLGFGLGLGVGLIVSGGRSVQRYREAEAGAWRTQG